MPKKDALKFAAVTWYDHAEYSGWQDPAGPEFKALLISSIGHIVAEDSDYLTISASRSEDGKFISPLVIIKKAIVKRKNFSHGS